ncbi:hypothetical protein DRW41_09000 [Neobacillus piezotolerans]|uniref:Uncharacterized protein n=1 Tax=Neobacillus piezotolerans TaxID=2259171 RepID=A0A3D8GU62_9BACI|nr:hypothetical protein [Neobacillus piezotolerans]RDU37937.1 hypothetical protein DRW41_09000 [Neobacillus piezotolerans]
MRKKSPVVFILSILLIIFLIDRFSEKKVRITMNEDNQMQAIAIQKGIGDIFYVENRTVKNPQKAEEILSMVEGLEVKEAKEKVRIESPDTYMFSFLKGDDSERRKMVPYSFFVLGDGTFVFTHEDVDKPLDKPLVTTSEHKELLDEIRQQLNLNF